MHFRYLGSGARKYGDRPLRSLIRPHYEIQVVLNGRIAPSITTVTPQPVSSHAWVFLPGYPHGWTAAPGTTAEVAVFHVPDLDDPLRSLVANQGMWSTDLDSEQLTAIASLIKKAEDLRRHPQPLTPLLNRRLLVELCLTLLHKVSALPMQRGSDRERAEGAVQWFEANIAYAPSIREVAEATGCSVATLRRSFESVFGASPQQVLNRSRFAEAQALLIGNQLDLSEIANLCGFGSAAAFSRAFKRHVGFSPDVWRRRQR